MIEALEADGRIRPGQTTLVEPKPEVIFLPPKEKVVELKPVDSQKQRPVARPLGE